MSLPESVSGDEHRSPGQGLVSILVPVFKNEAHLVALYERLASAMAPEWPEFELIFVNDSPPDESWSVIHELGERDPRVKGICLSRNFGQTAVCTFLRHLAESSGANISILSQSALCLRHSLLRTCLRSTDTLIC